jgi:hypothetical protein
MLSPYGERGQQPELEGRRGGSARRGGRGWMKRGKLGGQGGSKCGSVMWLRDEISDEVG